MDAIKAGSYCGEEFDEPLQPVNYSIAMSSLIGVERSILPSTKRLTTQVKLMVAGACKTPVYVARVGNRDRSIFKDYLVDPLLSQYGGIQPAERFIRLRS